MKQQLGAECDSFLLLLDSQMKHFDDEDGSSIHEAGHGPLLHNHDALLAALMADRSRRAAPPKDPELCSALFDCFAGFGMVSRSTFESA